MFGLLLLVSDEADFLGVNLYEPELKCALGVELLLGFGGLVFGADEG
jgi:hypothetical protein